MSETSKQPTKTSAFDNGSSDQIPEAFTSATRAESIRHPVQRGPSRVRSEDDEPEDSEANLQIPTNHERTDKSPAPSRPHPLRHPLQRTKTKILDHEQKKYTDAETLEVLHTQPPETRHSTIYKNKMARPRWVLHVQAQFWRVLMGLGMFFHRLAPPRPPKYNFVRTIPSTISGKPGNIDLYFYVPMGYGTQKQLWKDRPASDDEERESIDKGKQRSSSIGSLGHNLRRRGSSAKRWGGYPVVLNFHGGGFTLGSPIDDARWCSTVVDECNAVVISVDYRLAPECPFPTAVEDGVDAVIWVHQNADEIGIDPNKIALSGFSSGANMACTVPLRLWDEMMGFPREDDTVRPNQVPNQVTKSDNPYDSSPESSTSKLPQNDGSRVQLLDPSQPPPPLQRGPATKHNMEVRETVLKQVSDISLRAIVPWYPSLDYTRTRDQRRATCSRKDQELPALFTDLFDESYLHPPHSISLDSPYLSPGVAPTALLKNGLPHEIILHTCEWDMLLDEGQAFRDRLTSPEIDKAVTYTMIEGVPHGWDKAPNPWKPTPGVREHYLRACKELRRVFGERGVRERGVGEGAVSAAPRGSVQVVN